MLFVLFMLNFWIDDRNRIDVQCTLYSLRCTIHKQNDCQAKQPTLSIMSGLYNAIVHCDCTLT